MALLSANDFSCPICFEIYKDPVVLSCSHSFCKDCLQTWWAERVICDCPVCKRRSSKSDPPCNLALRNLCETFSQKLSLGENTSAGSEALCSLHSEKLRLFCWDHQQPVCVVCRDSRTHTGHVFKPIDEAAQDYRECLRGTLKPLTEKVLHLNQVKVDWDLTTEHIKVQAQNTERWIKDEFKMLQYFLQKEEEARITALREEEEQKSRMMKQRTEALSRKIAALSEIIRTTEEELKTADILFLQNYQAAVERIKQQPQLGDPQLASGALIDMAKHVGNLTFDVWGKMKAMVTYTPVILDPNTAESHLLMNKDLRSVRHAEGERKSPKNPERFECYITVLGSKSFNSGTHSWDVEVVKDANWAVGVIGESVQRKGETLGSYWELWFKDGKYRAYAPPYVDQVLLVRKQIERIRVHLDWNRGKLSFLDRDTNTNIYTFSQTFTEGLFPFLNTLSKKPVRILPVRVNVQLDM